MRTSTSMHSRFVQGRVAVIITIAPRAMQRASGIDTDRVKVRQLVVEKNALPVLVQAFKQVRLANA